MLCGIALLSINDALSKFLTSTYPVGQVVSLRQLAGLLVILPYVHGVSGWSALRVHNWIGQCTRGTLFALGSAMMVAALSQLPIATVTSITFAAPLLVAAFSGPVLKEKVSARRWGVIVLGFVGVLIIIRPGGARFHWVLLVPVLVAVINCFRDLLTRHLARTETSISVLFWSSNIVALLTACTAFFGWVPVTTAGAGWFALVGILNASSHFFMIEAFRRARAATVSPLRYTGLLWAAALGYLYWQEVPDEWLLLGSLFVITSGILLVRIESRGH
jgi:drug/metabolite transporter (DMT)-like permease